MGLLGFPHKGSLPLSTLKGFLASLKSMMGLLGFEPRTNRFLKAYQSIILTRLNYRPKNRSPYRAPYALAQTRTADLMVNSHTLSTALKHSENLLSYEGIYKVLRIRILFKYVSALLLRGLLSPF